MIDSISVIDRLKAAQYVYNMAAYRMGLMVEKSKIKKELFRLKLSRHER